MKRLTLLPLALLIAGSAAVAPVEAKTSRKAATRKTATAKREKRAVSLNTVISSLEKWQGVKYSQSFEQKLNWAKGFVSNVVTPYIRTKYPSRTSLSDTERCRMFYADLERYISNSDKYQTTTAMMTEASSLLADMSQATAYIWVATIESALADEASRQAWMNYASALDTLRIEISGLASDYAICKAGGGSMMAYITPGMFDIISEGMQRMLDQDFDALRGDAFKVTSTPAEALARFCAKIDYSTLDTELLEYLPSGYAWAVKDGPENITPLVDNCLSLYSAWVATLPANVRPRMAENLSVLIDAAISSISDDL